MANDSLAEIPVKIQITKQDIDALYQLIASAQIAIAQYAQAGLATQSARQWTETFHDCTRKVNEELLTKLTVVLGGASC